MELGHELQECLPKRLQDQEPIWVWLARWLEGLGCHPNDFQALVDIHLKGFPVRDYLREFSLPPPY